MHAQTLRTYDRLGLVSPQRSSGGGRRYSQHDVDLLREVQRLSQDEGVNLAGIKRIIELTNQVEALQSRLAELAEELERVARQAAPRCRGRAEEHGPRGLAAPQQTLDGREAVQSVDAELRHRAAGHSVPPPRRCVELGGRPHPADRCWSLAHLIENTAVSGSPGRALR